MKYKIQIFIVLVVSFLGGCSAENLNITQNEFKEITIESHPEGLGYASKRLEIDGKVFGMHLSGSQPPFVHQSEDKLSHEDIKKIKILINKAKTEQYSSIDNRIKSYLMVRIIFKDGAELVDYAPKEKQFKFGSNAIQEIWNIVSKNRAGAW